MGLRRVHEYTVDSATKTARIQGVFPIRRWVHQDHGPVNFQQGKFYDDGGNELPRESIPAYILENLAKHPVIASKDREAVFVRMCPICRDAGKDAGVPSNEFEAHLIAHARGQVEVAEKKEADE